MFHEYKLLVLNPCLLITHTIAFVLFIITTYVYLFKLCLHVKNKLKMIDKLCFYSGSANKPVGKGVNEYVKCYDDYKDLNNIPGWRRVLSNFYEADFEYNGMIYGTLEHAFQSVKISIADPGKAILFSKQSGSTLSKSSGLEARKCRKMVMLNDEQLILYHNEFKSIHREILLSKFIQVGIANKVLLLTGDSELWHSGPRIKKSRQHDLEYVRSKCK